MSATSPKFRMRRGPPAPVQKIFFATLSLQSKFTTTTGKLLNEVTGTYFFSQRAHGTVMQAFSCKIVICERKEDQEQKLKSQTIP